MLKLAPLTAQTQIPFLQYINQDPLDFYFFLFDYTHKHAQSEFTLALDEAGNIAGVLLVYRGCIVQVRGSCEAVRLLLCSLGAGQFEVSAPLNCKAAVLECFPTPVLAEPMTLMVLQRGKEHLTITTPPEHLDICYAEAVSALMREAYPAHWGNMTADALRSMFAETAWVGIKVGQTLAAMGVAAASLMGFHVMFIATSQPYRRRRYAQSIVSTLAGQILQNQAQASIHVMENNTAAKRTYEKVGFQPYKQYLYLKT
jgi:ribosomal protein S18 acetylase RimI-like enzyme